MWYSFTSLAAFTAWHDQVCADLGIPHPNRNAATGEVDETAQWTTAYTEPVIVADDDVRAFVEPTVTQPNATPSTAPVEPEVTP